MPDRAVLAIGRYPPSGTALNVVGGWPGYASWAKEGMTHVRRR
jgi:hypothetical protein